MNRGSNRQCLQDLSGSGERRDFKLRLFGLKILYVENAVAGNAVELKADFRQT